MWPLMWNYKILDTDAGGVGGRSNGAVAAMVVGLGWGLHFEGNLGRGD